MKLLNYFKQKTKNEYKHLNLIYSNLFKSKSRLIILLYHRIVPEISINPVGTYINCIDFEKQIKYLSNKYEIIDLSQLSENLNKYKRDGTRRKKIVQKNLGWNVFADKMIRAYKDAWKKY